MKSINLSNKIAVITGASQGIGRSIAIEIANCGAKVILTARNKEKLQNVKDLIINSGHDAEIFCCDISNLSECFDLINYTSKTWGAINILVNNAGITKDKILIKMSENEWDNVINTNLKGCFNMIKAAYKPMLKSKWGRIINIGSVIGQIGNSGQSNYSASKAGIIGLTKSMAKELGARNITVNSVAPGYVKTDMTENLTNELKQQMLISIPLKRFAEPEDISNIVCFLASDYAEYITGQTFNVDGGMVMK